MNTTAENNPQCWLSGWPTLNPDGHKYDRGHLLVSGGGIAQTGAAKLAAISALRIGAGLVSIACDRESLPVYAASLLAVMTKPAEQESDYQALAHDPRMTAFLIGPGAGVSERTRTQVRIALATGKPVLLDADALTIYSQQPQSFFTQFRGPVVITPHEGEFARLFQNTKLDLSADRLTRAHEAARLCGAVVILKGAQTVIAAPDGRCIINHHASPHLATAGTGDVLAGIVAGLLAQGMEPYAAACAGVWIHGEAGRRFGAGLIAEDLPSLLPPILHELFPAKASRA